MGWYMKINESTGVFVSAVDEYIFNHKFDEQFLINIISDKNFPSSNMINQLNNLVSEELNTHTSIRKYIC